MGPFADCFGPVLSEVFGNRSGRKASRTVGRARLDPDRGLQRLAGLAERNRATIASGTSYFCKIVMKYVAFF